MFTGIIQAIGTVLRLEARPFGVRLTVNPHGWDAHCKPGDSISVAGCCLTLVEDSLVTPPAELSFDVVSETLRMTTLSQIRVGGRVNLEASATPQTALGGHLVQGHVDGIGQILATSQTGEFRLRIGLEETLMSYVVPKGSIAIDGVSLTVATVSPSDRWFEVALIPTTLERTTLGTLAVGAVCNIETDIVARTLVHWATYYGKRGPTTAY